MRCRQKILPILYFPPVQTQNITEQYRTRLKIIQSPIPSQAACELERLQYKVTMLQGYKVTRLQGYKVGYKVTRLQGLRLHYFKVTRLQAHVMTWF